MRREQRRLPIGAEVVDGGVHVRVWAPRRRRVEALLEHAGSGHEQATVELHPEAGGYYSALVPFAAAGTRYRFRLDGDGAFPDPASRFQPEGPHGPSEVVDPRRFAWTDHDWPGVGREGQVLYELHVGTFTPEGTWAAALEKLPLLRELGVTVLEVMPVAEFPGRFGWGYDGVDLFAPTRLYGRPDDFRRFVDAAHRLGLGVILDVVYNHLGPDGNYLAQYGAYFTDRYQNEWGEPFDFDGPESAPVRELVVSNARYWVDEFHLDGLRLDATQAMHDASAEHVVQAIERAVREAAGGRKTLLVAENEPQQARILRPRERGGFGLDAAWNDDFHHSLRVALTGRSEAYYTDYTGSPQSIVSCAKRGYLYQGQWYRWQKQRRGQPTHGLPPAAFVCFLQNHDQIANSLRGDRIDRLTSPGRLRAATALLLLGPWTPMLFQGQEWCASAPFLYFADHHAQLAPLVQRGRAEFLRQFPSIARPEASALLDDPASGDTFERSRLDWAERERHAHCLALHRDLLRLRREDPVFRAQAAGGLDGAVLGPQAFCLRFFDEREGDRLLVVNLGADLALSPVPEPLLAPPEGSRWELLWTSDHPSYGGLGTPAPETDGQWRLQGEGALVLRARPREPT